MKKILITYGTRPLAQRIGNMLKNKYEVTYGSCESFPDLLKKQNYFVLQTAANPVFVHELLKVCLDEGIDVVLPLGEAEYQPLHQARILLAEYGVDLLLPDSFSDYFTLENPPKELSVQVFKDGQDLMTDAHASIFSSGAAVRSDSGDDFALCVV